MTQRILLQIDADQQPSSFDSVVAIDAGVDQLLCYGAVDADALTSLVHGAMFTRGGDDLKRTAIFVGGSDVSNAERIFERVQQTFFGPVRVSVMLDANGCNTTAAAAVVTAAKHQPLAGARAIVLGGTGPVGRRVAELLAQENAQVVLASRSQQRAAEACEQIAAKHQTAQLTAAATHTQDQLERAIEGAAVVVACGAAGVELADEATLKELSSLAVAIDLNAVPPAGIGGVSAMDKAVAHGHGVAYGAIGVGGLKMRTHKAAIKSLFEQNDRVLNASEIYAIAKSIEGRE